MIAGWLLYCLAVSGLLVVAGAAIDNMLTARGQPARWVWVAVMVGTLGIPETAYLLQQRAPRPLPGAGSVPTGSIIDRFPAWRLDAQRGAVTATHRVDIRRPQTPEFSDGDRLAVDVAILCIVLAALRVTFDSVLLYRSRRHWTPDVVDGVPVLMSDDLGPAIVGLIQPAIVLPRWTLALEPDERALMLVHEGEHARANDSRLTTIALLAVICMPWNPAMWWALRRLRTAIEVDCDRRVLRLFPDVKRYGRLLVDVAQRAVGSSLAIAGFSERAAPLARRIQAMTPVGARRSLRDASAGVLGALALVGSVALLPPAAPLRSLPALAYTGRTVALPKNVGDSIAEGEEPPVVIAAATDLPASFVIVELGRGAGGRPVVGRCAQRLRDERDGTALLESMSMTSTVGVLQRRDTAWTRIGSIGFYWVTPPGRYGVHKDQTLRVGCGSYTHITVEGREIISNALSTLDSPGDDRARQIARQMSVALRVEPAAVELYAGRLDVVVTDFVPKSPGDDEGWTLVHQVFALSRDLLGMAAMPETLTVSLRTGRDQWHTLYDYKSMEK